MEIDLDDNVITDSEQPSVREQIKQLIAGRVQGIASEDEILNLLVQIIDNEKNTLSIDITDLQTFLCYLNRVDMASASCKNDELAKTIEETYERLQAAHPGQELYHLLLIVDVPEDGNCTISHLQAIGQFVEPKSDRLDIVWCANITDTITDPDNTNVHLIAGFEEQATA